MIAVIYAVILALGILSLTSPQDPIGDPYFAIMELLILFMAPLMVVSMVAVHVYSPSDLKVYSLTALALMILLTGITSSVHFVILTVRRQVDGTPLRFAPYLMPTRRCR